MEKHKYIRKTVTWQGRRYEVRGKTEEEALKKLAELAAALERGEGSSGLTVDQWFRQWKATYKDPLGITPKSLGLYAEKYNGYIRPAIGAMPLAEVRDLDLQAILNTQAGKSYSHVSKLRMVMQELFRQARRSRLILYDPAEGLQLPDCVRGSHRSITPEEREHILAVAEDHPAGLWVRTILYSGLRPGEAAALTWADVDFDRNEIHVTKAVESGSGAIKAPKTPAGVRDVPMRRELRELLWAARGEPAAPVFPNAKGRFRNASSARRLWDSFAKALDLHMGAEVENGVIVRHAIAPDLTPYCLRHTFCTDLQRAGVPINVAKELMGHANISVTANIYTHRDQDVLHTNMAKLDAAPAPRTQKGEKGE
jgi:integrase